MASSNQRASLAQRMISFQSKQTDINRLILNNLVREGYKNISQTFEVIAKLESGAQLDTQEYKMRIRQAVRSSQVQYALDMAKRLYPRLFESDSYMYFHMQQLRLLELIRTRKIDKSPELGEKLDQAEESTPYQDVKCELASNLEPKMMFLVRLILWAQGKLENDDCVASNNNHNNLRYDLQDDDFDFELELQRAMQHD